MFDTALLKKLSLFGDNSACFTYHLLFFIFLIVILFLAMLKEKLLEIGFSKNEAILYLLLLRIGPSPVSSLAVRSGLKRATAYSVLNALQAKNLVSYEMIGASRRYLPLDPQIILYDLEQKSTELQVRIRAAKECLAMLEDVNLAEIDRRILLGFNGTEATLKALRQHLKDGPPIYAQISCWSESFMKSLRNFKSPLYLHGSVEIFPILVEVFPEAHKECRKDLINKGVLIFQENRLFYLREGNKQVEMLFLQDSFCISYLRDLLFPNF